jgi:hypothetical protein
MLKRQIGPPNCCIGQHHRLCKSPAQTDHCLRTRKSVEPFKFKETQIKQNESDQEDILRMNQ